LLDNLIATLRDDVMEPGKPLTADDKKPPVIEAKPDGAAPQSNEGGLGLRLRQQEILAELGVTALQGSQLTELLDQTAKLVAEGLEAEFCKILEYHPGENRFLVTAGIGWGPDVIGVATVGADAESPAGFALITGKPVISNHLENEERFRTPQLLVQHGIRRAMNVILQGDGAPYGVLEVDSRSEGEFSVRDISFLQGAANVLGMAIERHRIERNLRTALERNQLLLREVNHRINNSLALVASMLHLKAATVNDEIKAHLDEASLRITAIARAHQRLYQTEKFETLDLGAYLEDICRNLSESLPACEVHVSTVVGIEIPPDQAVPIALFVNELITNSTKHRNAGSDCEIWVTVKAVGERSIAISVRDNGPGLPADFDLTAQKGLGMRLISAFSKQLRGELTIHRHTPGTEFVLLFPIAMH
jgi:two-component sensor histidine kinase